ncbi:MAG: LEA type 2 family protein [Bacteroidetes bacterium]|nr:LEA type 2 family protein [Bacteroidota bacterium]
MKKYIYILAALFGTLFISCKDLQDLSFSGIENVKIIKMSQQGAEADITAKIKNPNRAAFTIYRSELDVTLGGINAGKAHLTKSIRIKGNTEQLYTFRIKSDFSSLTMNDLPKLMSLAKSKNVRVGLKGNLRAGKFFIKRNYPVDLSESVPMSLN